MTTSHERHPWLALSTGPEALLRVLDDLPYPAHVTQVDPERRYPWIAANQAALDALGVSRDDLREQPLEARIPDAHAAAVMVERRHEVVSSCRPVTFELTVDLSVGVRAYETTLIPLVDETGSCTQIFGVWHDRSEPQEALRRQLDHHAALVEALQDGLLEVDAGLNVTYVNDRFCDMTGLARDALIGRGPPYPWWPPDEVDIARRAADAVHRGGGELETRFCHLDGHSFPVSVSISARRRAQGELIGVVVTARDITERKRAEAALEQRTAAQALVADLSRELLYGPADEVDATIERGLERATVFLDADGASLTERSDDDLWAVVTHRWQRTPNAEAHDRLPASDVPWFLEVLERGELVCARSLDQLPPAAHLERDLLERAGVRSLACLPVRTEERLTGTLSFHWRRRESADYSAALDVLKVLGDVFVVALHRKRAELARRDDEARFRKLVQHASDVIAVLDASSRLTYVSPAARTYGWDPDELVGRPAADLVHPDDVEKVSEHLLVRVDDRPREMIEFRLRAADGSWRYVEAQGETLLDGSGVSGIVVTLHDVTIRKNANAALRASEARYRALVEGGPDLIFRLHRDGTIVNVHGNLTLLDGGDAAAVIGRRVTDIRPASYTTPLLKHVARALDTGSLETFEYELAIGGKTRWFEARIAPIGRDEVLDIVRDVTERTWAEAALRESEERFRALVQNTSDVITVLDADGTLLYASPAVESIFGAKPEWILGMCVFDFAHPHDRERIQQAFAEGTKAPGHGETVQFRMQHVDGSWRHVESVGNNLLHDPAVRGVVLTTRDISERKQAEAALRQSEERFRALVQQTSDLITVVDPSGDMLYASPSARAILGWAEGEYLGRTALELIHPDDRDTLIPWFGEILRRPRRAIGPVENRVRHADGSWRQLEAVGTNLLDDPAIGGIVITSRDVTERRQLEDQLLQLQKMEAIGRLAGGIAHDFNNLLTAISGYTALLLDDLPLDDSRRGDLVEIDHAAARGAALVDQLLAFSRRKMLQPSVLDLDEVVHSMRGLLSRVIGNDVHLVTRLGGDLPGVRADRSQIERVILNLVINARDAMPHGGDLHLETAVVELDERHAASHLRARTGLHVMLAVRDTGVGMDSQTRSQAFEPFFTTKEPGQGTGLGLSTVYGIVAQARGHLAVESEIGTGSVFRAYFPAVDAGVETQREVLDG